MKKVAFGELYEYENFYYKGRLYCKVNHGRKNKHGNAILRTPRIIRGVKQAERRVVHVFFYDSKPVFVEES